MKALSIVVHELKTRLKFFVHANADTGGTTIALRTFVPAKKYIF